MVKKTTGSKKPQAKKSKASKFEDSDDDGSNLDAGIKFENLEFDDDYGNEEDGDDSGSIEDLAGRIKFDGQADDEIIDDDGDSD
jgi:hypothetical protein